jgi:hypothetical protein
MKFLFKLFVLTLTISVYSQIPILPKLTYEQTQDSDVFVKIKNNTLLTEYITKSGNSIKVGDTLIIGKPTSSVSTTRGAQGYGGIIASTSNRKEFEYIQLGRPAGFGAIMGALGGQAPAMAGIGLSGEIVVVSELKAYHKGSKKKPLSVTIVIGEINGKAFGVNKFLSAMDTEGAIELGELYLKNRKKTRDEAIAELKEAKDLLDLEMMSQEDYDRIKTELTPIIMNKK